MSTDIKLNILVFDFFLMIAAIFFLLSYEDNDCGTSSHNHNTVHNCDAYVCEQQGTE